jgi:hypothetical protein
MRRIYRVVMLVTLIALAPALVGCENFDPDSLDPFGLNKKQPLPGDRRPLFPEGVPGVSQGVPAEYMKGHEDQQPGAAIDIATAPVPGQPGGQTASAQPAAEKPKAKPKAKPKPHQAARAPTQVRVQRPAPAAPPAQQPAAAQTPAQQQPQQAQSPWPASAPAAQQAPAPWPSAPPPGTFSKQ